MPLCAAEPSFSCNETPPSRVSSGLAVVLALLLLTAARGGMVGRPFVPSLSLAFSLLLELLLFDVAAAAAAAAVVDVAVAS